MIERYNKLPGSEGHRRCTQLRTGQGGRSRLENSHIAQSHSFPSNSWSHLKRRDAVTRPFHSCCTETPISSARIAVPVCLQLSSGLPVVHESQRCRWESCQPCTIDDSIPSAQRNLPIEGIDSHRRANHSAGKGMKSPRSSFCAASSPRNYYRPMSCSIDHNRIKTPFAIFRDEFAEILFRSARSHVLRAMATCPFCMHPHSAFLPWPQSQETLAFVTHGFLQPPEVAVRVEVLV